VTTLAGSSSGFVNGTGTSAKFKNPSSVIHVDGNLYVTDSNNNAIRKIVISTGVVTTLAGSTSSGSTDGTGTSARFDHPIGITSDGTNLYVAANKNHNIRKIVIATGVVTTIAGSTSSGSTNGTGTSARFNFPRGITTDGTNLYVSDSYNHKIRKIVISTGAVTTLAGSGQAGSTDATGTSAKFNYPRGITTDGANLYVTDKSNHKIRKIVISTGVVTTIAGSGSSGSTDASGTSAKFYGPLGNNRFGKQTWMLEIMGNHKIPQIALRGTGTAKCCNA
jgi:NHL repeat.